MESRLFPSRIWCATALIAFTFFGFTLTSAVPVWIDERLHPRMLGSAIQELAYRATEPSNLGPRVAALLGQLAAFGYLLYYFRLRGVNDRFSLLLGLAFLIDPLCDIGWRGGRVDSWALRFSSRRFAAFALVPGGAFFGEAWLRRPGSCAVGPTQSPAYA